MLGIDIVEHERFKKLIKDKRFLERIFSDSELAYVAKNRKNRLQHLAVRFAAKEAVWKALNGKQKISITDITVKNETNGMPKIYIKNKPAPKIFISLSHTKNTSVAVAIIK